MKNAQEALELKQQVISRGLEINKDFTWNYVPGNDYGWEASESTAPEVRFDFTDPVQETFFSMLFK